MEGQGGEKGAGVKKGMPYSGSNSREQVNTDMVPSTCSYQPLQDDLLLEPYSHILSVPGKNIRGKLIRCEIYLSSAKHERKPLLPPFPLLLVTLDHAQGFQQLDDG